MELKQKEYLSVLGYFFLQNGKVEKAHTVFKALNVLYPEEPRFLGLLSYTCLLSGNFDEARSLAERYLAGASSEDARPEGYLLLSKAQWGLGRADAAHDMLNRFLNQKRGHRENEPG